MGDAYARAINCFDINLAFLRKLNRDLQTTRSVEIPACGAFMLAERTDEHRALFEEGVEAEYFADDDELLAKVRRYLEAPELRHAVATAGRQRCIDSGYSNQDRMRKMFAILASLHQDEAGLARASVM
jgi:spore maturation protein CgeB